MSRVIQFPEIKKGGLRAVAYGCQDVAVYDDISDPRQAVWNELRLEDAEAFIDAVLPYIEAHKVNELECTEESQKALDIAEDTLIPLYRAPAKKIAEGRWV